MGAVIDPPLSHEDRVVSGFCFKQRTGSACSHGVAVVRTGQRVPSRESQSRALGSVFSHGVAVEPPESQTAATVTSRSAQPAASRHQ